MRLLFLSINNSKNSAVLFASLRNPAGNSPFRKTSICTSSSRFLSKFFVAVLNVYLFSLVRSTLVCTTDARKLMASSNISINSQPNFEAISFCIEGYLSFYQVTVSNRKEQEDQAEEIDHIPCINHAPAHAAIMIIDPSHFNIIIRTTGKYRQFADSIKPIV